MKRIKYILLFLLLLGLSAPVYAKKEKALLKVGILSDVHLKGHARDSVFVGALEYFKMSDVDAVILAGDYTCDGTEKELEHTAELWFSVFPEDKGRKGKHVERVFVYGNHELEGHTYNQNPQKFSAEFVRDHVINNHKAEFWEKYWKQPFKPFYTIEVKGYTFIAAQYVDKFSSPGEIPGLKEYFNEIGPNLPKDKPVFFVMHKHPRWTAGYAQDNGASSRVLRDYPNLICFSGHCHSPLTDERSIWQGSFTSVNTSTLHKIGIKSGRENSKSKDPNYVSQMNGISPTDGHHGMLMEVFADRVVLHRHDFHFNEELGDWVIPNDTTIRPYSIKDRTEAGKTNPPAFDKAANVTYKKVLGKDRNKVPSEQVRVYFPAAVSNNGHPRAFDYEVAVEKMNEDGTVETILKKIVFSKNFYHSEARDKEKTAVCYFSVLELPISGSFRFAVRPRDSFENRGEAIYSKPVTL